MPLSENLIFWQDLIITIFGLIIGSFLNVCIYRIPENKSLLIPSACPHCGTKIPFYRNIPFLTYLFQMGKTACCEKKIAIQYPMIELLSAALAVVTFHHTANAIDFLIWYLLFLCPLLVISVIDFRLRIIPDVLSLPLIAIGTAVHMYTLSLNIWPALLDSVLGIVIGGGSLLLVAEVISRLKKTEALGGGDIKLTAMLGAFLGWKPILFIYFFSSILALIYIGGTFLLPGKRGQTVIPFGPFLSMAGMLFFFYGKPITDWYFFSNGFPINPLFP